MAVFGFMWGKYVWDSNPQISKLLREYIKNTLR